MLQLLDLAGHHRERLLELVEPVLDVDGVTAPLRRGRGRQGKSDEESEPGREDLHGQRFVHIKRGHFQA